MSLTRSFYIAVFLACLALLGFGLYLEHVKGLEPCPLCIFQRMTYIAIAMISFIAAIHDPQRVSRFFYGALMVIASGIGISIAGRQTWLQHLPADQVPACGPGLDYMFEVFPFMQALEMVFKGSGECAEVQWTFLGFSIAEWSLVCFSVILIMSIIIAFIMRPRERRLFS